MNLYTVKKTAKIIGCSTNTLYKYLNEGRIKASRGTNQQGRFRIPQSAIEDFLGTSLNSSQAKQSLPPAGNFRAHLPLTLIRVLILISLFLILFDIIVTRSVSTATQITRLTFVAIAMLLAYQQGGYLKKT